MKQEINPKEKTRAEAFERWMKSPMPMVTFTKTFDVTRVRKVSKQRGIKFNMLLCWCIGKAASKLPEFYLLPIDGKLFKFDCLAINVIVDNKEGGISSCDVLYSDDLEQFNADYHTLTQAAHDTSTSTSIDDAMIIGTSAILTTELDAIVNQYTGIFNNPFLAWGKYRCHLFKTTLPISLQFHHAQMDGGQAARFLNELQQTFHNLSAT